MKIKLVSIALVSSISCIILSFFGSFSFAQTDNTTLDNDAQSVVDSLEKLGFDVTFVYFGSNKTLTYGLEECAVVVMRTFEHVRNFQFTNTQEQQVREGKNALTTRYPNAEVFIVFLFEDTDQNSTPDNWPGSTGYYTATGSGFGGGKTSTAFFHDYWTNADDYVKTGSTTPAPTQIQTQQPTQTTLIPITAPNNQTPFQAQTLLIAAMIIIIIVVAVLLVKALRNKK